MQQMTDPIRLYATKAFMVERFTQQEAACLTRLRDAKNPSTVSSVTFVGNDADQFLIGLTQAMLEMPGNQVEEQYLSAYSSVMQDHVIH